MVRVPLNSKKGILVCTNESSDHTVSRTGVRRKVSNISGSRNQGFSRVTRMYLPLRQNTVVEEELSW